MTDEELIKTLTEEKNELIEETLELSHQWYKSKKEKRQLEETIDEAIEYLKYALDEEKETPSKHNDWRLDLLEILERGKEDE